MVLFEQLKRLIAMQLSPQELALFLSLHEEEFYRTPVLS